MAPYFLTIVSYFSLSLFKSYDVIIAHLRHAEFLSLIYPSISFHGHADIRGQCDFAAFVSYFWLDAVTFRQALLYRMPQSIELGYMSSIE